MPLPNLPPFPPGTHYLAGSTIEYQGDGYTAFICSCGLTFDGARRAGAALRLVDHLRDNGRTWDRNAIDWVNDDR